MNLIHDPWIQVIDAENEISHISPAQITHNVATANPIVDVIAVRPDFKGALFQFLVGLLQTAVTPANDGEWFARWETPPNPDELDEKLSGISPAFDFSGEIPSFMQDFDLPEGESKPINALLIEAPGGKTLKDNLDHFVQRGKVEGICPQCAALALFTLQVNSPAGGVGYRTGLRGGGPLTTLILPDESANDTLWHKLWLNVLPEKICRRLLTNYNWDPEVPGNIFPWVAPTRTSEKKGGKDTFPGDVHPYHMYWAMPRRIRLDFQNGGNGTCDLCGANGQQLIRYFITRNYGTNYNGPWEHPLTPYSRRRQDDLPLPLHGQKGGVTYRNWLGLTIGQEESEIPAHTVNHYLERRIHRVGSGQYARLWAFGFDMDKMKARCWYDSVMPLYHLDPAVINSVKALVADFISAAEEASLNLRQEVKKAWFKRPKDKKGDWAFIDQSFWQATEDRFYQLLKEAITTLEKKHSTAEISKKWHGHLRQTAMDHFDRLVMAGQIEDMELERVVKARRNLSIWLNTGKQAKKLLGK